MDQAQKTTGRIKKGTVVSTKMQKTVVVKVDAYKVHPKYGKRYKVTRKFYVHDEDSKCAQGNIVSFVETKPLSKLKRWNLLEVLS